MRTGFEWIAFYTELANKILLFKNNRAELLSKFFTVFERTNMKNYFKDGDGQIFTDVCPFTVMGVFNRGLTNANRIAILNELARTLQIDVPVPESFDGIPVLNAMKAWFFGGNDYDRAAHIDKLWELFETSIYLADNPNQDAEYQFAKLFDFVLTQPCSRWNITFGLFWIRPYRYITLDGNTRTYINNEMGMGYTFNKVPSGKHYLEMCTEIQSKISSDEYINSFPALSQEAWLTKGNSKYLREDFVKWISTQTKPNGEQYTSNTVTAYVNALKNACRNLSDVDFIQPDLFFQTDAQDFTELKTTIRNSGYYESVNIKAGNGAFSAGMNLYEKFLSEREEGIAVPPNSSAASAISANPSTLSSQVSDVQYWAYSPGANASYWDEFYSKGIMGIGWDEVGDLKHLQSREQIIERMGEVYPEKTTFKNDSLALWDFVSKMRIGDIVYAKSGRKTIVGRGIVKSGYIFDEARDELKHIRKIEWTHSGQWNLNEQIAMKTLTDFTPYEQWCREMERLICIKDTKDLPFYTKDDFLSEVYMSDEKYQDAVTLLERKRNIILQGAPGVGKSFMAKRLAYSIIGLKDADKVEMVQFHQSYSYEDFIEGFRPGESGSFEIRQGVFYRFCQKAKNDKANKYFFIIDEINRGNLSKIMGELMLLLENDKRGVEFSLPLTYSGERFYVPENVYVIGMMNTADRSLAMMDYALRRRFSFVPVEPAFDNERFIADFETNYSDAESVIEKVKKLNALIVSELDNGHQIGHSYFCSENPLSKNDIDGIFKYEITELLREYFFDNDSKLAEALKLL